MQAELLQRITINPEVCHGKPTVRIMRYPVSLILDLLSAGITTEELIADYPALEKEDIQACLFYASRLCPFTGVLHLQIIGRKLFSS